MENLENLSKEELIYKIYESKKITDQINLLNTKLAHSFQLLSSFHLTVEEKLKIAEEFDILTKETEVIDYYERKVNELQGQFPDEEIDYRWSPGFAREMIQYFKHYKEYDPFFEIEGFFGQIKDYFNLQETLEFEENINKNDKKVETIKETLKQQKPKMRNALESIDIILKDVKN